MTYNSRNARKTIRKLLNAENTSYHPCLVSANQVAHQLLVNCRDTLPSKPKCPVLPPTENASTIYPVSEEEYRKGVTVQKNNKDAGRATKTY